MSKGRFWESRAPMCVIGCVLLFVTALGLSAAGAAGKSKTEKHGRKPPVAVTVSISRSKLSVKVSAASGSACILKVVAGRSRQTFPRFHTGSRGRGVVTWAIPSNAPAGKWSFSVRCTRSRKTHSAFASAFILTAGSGTGGLAAPNSVQLTGGAVLGGKGGGATPCAPVAGGGQQCFPSDPYDYYQGGSDIGQCTWYAVGRRPDLGGITTGNAYQFISEAHAHGVPTGAVPVPGSIAVNTTYRDRSGTLLGHVAYVDSVSPDRKTLVVDEANVIPLTITLNVTVPASEFQGYVYGGPAGNGPGSSGGSGGVGGNSGTSASGTGYETAFQANTGSLIEFGAGGNANTTQGMMAGTSPSIAALPGGGYEMAFQANTGNLIVYGTAGDINTQQGMKPGTSPSIAASPKGGFEVAFQANTGNLCQYNSATGAANLQQGMDNGTSPSIAALPGGGYEIAFQANTGNLIVYGAAANTNTGQGMMPGSSPSIAASPSGGFQAAFEANTGYLYRYNSASGPADLQQGMNNQTSPSIAALPTGGYEMAFQANTGNLFVYGDDGGGDTHQGMKASTSPSIAAAPQGGFQVAFQANTGNLYQYNSASGAANLQQGLDNNTSPSIAP